MDQAPALTLCGVVLDSPDARDLAAFYRRLLGWEVAEDEPDWVRLPSPAGGAGLSFQTESRYVRPVWPAGPGDPQMSVHLDIVVEDLAAAASMPSRPAPCWLTTSPRMTCASTWTRPGTRSASLCAISPAGPVRPVGPAGPARPVPDPAGHRRSRRSGRSHPRPGPAGGRTRPG